MRGSIDIRGLEPMHYAAIGKLVANFGAVEHSFGKMILFESVKKQADSALEDQLDNFTLDTREVEGALGARAAKVRSQIKDDFWGKTTSVSLLGPFEAFEKLIQVRNAACHGSWTTDANSLQVQYWSNKKIAKKEVPVQFNKTVLEWSALADNVLKFDRLLNMHVLKDITPQ